MSKRGKMIDRSGEEGINKFGSKMIIIKYEGKENLDVFFPEYNWTFKHATYQSFKNGFIKCPYEPRVYGVGYIGEGIYKSWENGKPTKCYETWKGMLRRCYDPKCWEKHPSYEGCNAEKYFFNFQQFASWMEDHYYEIPGERVELDKDILIRGNKLYSRDTCLFVPRRINTLLLKRQNDRGECIIGVSPNGKNYLALCDDKYGKQIYLGTYTTQKEAFKVYKLFKEQVIKEVAEDYYNKGYVPYEVYKALLNYEVKITD